MVSIVDEVVRNAQRETWYTKNLTMFYGFANQL